MSRSETSSRRIVFFSLYISKKHGSPGEIDNPDQRICPLVTCVFLVLQVKKLLETETVHDVLEGFYQLQICCGIVFENLPIDDVQKSKVTPSRFFLQKQSGFS